MVQNSFYTPKAALLSRFTSIISPKSYKRRIMLFFHTCKKQLVRQFYLRNQRAFMAVKNRYRPAVLFSEEKREEYLLVLETLMLQKRPYLIKRYTIQDMTEDTGIPIFHLSYLINSQFNMNFQNFINLKRVEYIKLRFQEEEWKQLSLEGIALKAGFTSRTTFFRAFIRNTGMAPSSYICLTHSQSN